MEEVAEYNVLEIAASTGRRNAVVYILKHELADPDLSPPGKLLKLAEPYRSKDPSLRPLLKVVCVGWSPESHWQYPKRIRDAVHTVILVQERLWRRRQAAVPSAGGGTAAAAASTALGVASGGAGVAGDEHLPELLPSELWIFCILRLAISRKWWKKAPSLELAAPPED